MLALFPPDDRSQDLKFRSLRQQPDLIDDLVDGLAADLLTAARAMGRADPGPEQAQVIVDLCDRPYGGARIF